MSDVPSDEYLMQETVEEVYADVIYRALENDLEGVSRERLIIAKCYIDRVREGNPKAILCLERIADAFPTASNEPINGGGPLLFDHEKYKKPSTEPCDMEPS